MVFYLVKITDEGKDFSFSGDDSSDVTVTFEVGTQANSTKCKLVSILDDEELEGNHTITLTIMEDPSSNFTTVEPDATEIVIIDNEGNITAFQLSVLFVFCQC